MFPVVSYGLIPLKSTTICVCHNKQTSGDGGGGGASITTLPGQRTLGECCTIMLGLSSTTKRMGSRGVQEPRRKSRRRPLCSSVRRVVHPHRVTSPVTLGLLTCKFAGHCQCDGCYIILGRLLQLVRSPVAQVPRVTEFPGIPV